MSSPWFWTNDSGLQLIPSNQNPLFDWNNLGIPVIFVRRKNIKHESKELVHNKTITSAHFIPDYVISLHEVIRSRRWYII